MAVVQAEAPVPAAQPAAAPRATAEPAKDSDDEDELEQMHEAEDLAIDSTPPAPGANLREQLEALGLSNPYRTRLEEALERAEASGEVALEPAGAGDRPGRASTWARCGASTTFPIEMQPLVAQYIHFFQRPGRKWFRQWMSRSTRYIPMMHADSRGQRACREIPSTSR